MVRCRKCSGDKTRAEARARYAAAMQAANAALDAANVAQADVDRLSRGKRHAVRVASICVPVDWASHPLPA